eukprot:scaffold107269_cov34-Tisochrysis_lutea.AAC.4
MLCTKLCRRLASREADSLSAWSAHMASNLEDRQASPEEAEMKESGDDALLSAHASRGRVMLVPRVGPLCLPVITVAFVDG